MSKTILVEESFAGWRKDPKYVEAYEALEDDFSFAAALIESLTEACEHAEGKPTSVRVHVVEVPEHSPPKRRTTGSGPESK